MITHNLNVDNTLPDILDRLAALERNAQGRHMSVTEGLFRFYGGKLMGLAGAVLEWIGTILFTGLFKATGSSIFEGPVSITGATGTLDVAADAAFGGDVQITETLDVTATTRLRAATTVEDDLTITGGGKVIAGVLVIDGTSGGRIASSADLLLVANFGHFVKATAFQAESILVNNNATVLGGMTVVENVELIGNLDVPNLPTTANAPNVWFDPATGRLHYKP